MKTLLNAAKYLVKDRGFTPIYDSDPMFDDPVVPASQHDTFVALHLLASVANGTDVAYISVRRVMEWLNQKSRAANA